MADASKSIPPGQRPIGLYVKAGRKVIVTRLMFMLSDGKRVDKTISHTRWN